MQKILKRFRKKYQNIVVRLADTFCSDRLPFAAAAREKVTTRVSSAQVNNGNLRRCTHAVQRVAQGSGEQEIRFSCSTLWNSAGSNELTSIVVLLPSFVDTCPGGPCR